MAQCASLIAPYGLRSRVGRAGSGRMMNRLTSKQPRTTALLLAAISLAAPNSSTVAESRPCRAMEYERSAYTIYEVDLRQQTIRLYWKRPDGTPYAYLSALPRPLKGEAGKLLFDQRRFLSRLDERGQEPQSCEWPVDMLDVLNFPFTARSGTTRARARTMAKSFSARFRH